MELEELRKHWQHTQIHTPSMEDEASRIASEGAYSRAATALQRLARRYRIMMYSGIALPLLSPLLVYELNLPVWAAVVYGLFGVVMAILNGMFSRYLGRCDLMSQPLVTALSMSERIIRRQSDLYIFGLGMGTILVGLLFYFIYSICHIDVLAGALCGLLIGVFIGIRKCRANRRLARQIRLELRSALSSDRQDAHF